MARKNIIGWKKDKPKVSNKFWYSKNLVLGSSFDLVESLINVFYVEGFFSIMGKNCLINNCDDKKPRIIKLFLKAEWFN